MNIYAQTTSDRSSKGQGGNRFIQVKLTVGDTKQPVEIGIVTLEVIPGGYRLALDRSSNLSPELGSRRVYDEIIEKKQ